MVAPLAADVEIAAGQAELLEAGFQQHALRAEVVEQRAGLDPVQADRVERLVHHLLHGRRREAAAVVLARHEVADVGRLEGPRITFDSEIMPATTPSSRISHE